MNITESNIGQLVARSRRGYTHLLDAVTADRVTTACGKTMNEAPNRNGALELEPGDAAPGCMACWRISVRRQRKAAVKA